MLITLIYNYFQTATGNIPTPRAAHAACNVNENQLIIYGGAAGSKHNFISNLIYIYIHT